MSSFKVFSFLTPGGLNLNKVVKNAYRNLDGTVYVLDESGCQWSSSRVLGEGRDELGSVRGFEKFSTLLRIASRNQAWDACFRVTPRAITREDIAAAQSAAKGTSAGLAAIAEKCQAIWEVAPELAPEFPKTTFPPGPAAVFSCAGVLGATGLGPILFEDGTLLDHKQAWARAAEFKPAA